MGEKEGRGSCSLEEGGGDGNCSRAGDIPPKTMSEGGPGLLWLEQDRARQNLLALEQPCLLLTSLRPSPREAWKMTEDIIAKEIRRPRTMLLSFCWVGEHGDWEGGPLDLRKVDSDL